MTRHAARLSRVAIVAAAMLSVAPAGAQQITRDYVPGPDRTAYFQDFDVSPGGRVFVANAALDEDGSQPPESVNAWALTLAPDGGVLSSHETAELADAVFTLVRALPDEGAIFAGTTRASLTGGSNEIVVARVAPDAGLAWVRSYATALTGQDKHPTLARVLGDGGILLAGGISVVGIGADTWLMRLDADGDVQWQIDLFAETQNVLTGLELIDQEVAVVSTLVGRNPFGGGVDERSCNIAGLDLDTGALRWNVSPLVGSARSNCRWPERGPDGRVHMLLQSLGAAVPSFGWIDVDADGEVEASTQFDTPHSPAFLVSQTRAPDGSRYILARSATAPAPDRYFLLAFEADDVAPLVSATGIDSTRIVSASIQWHEDRLVYSGAQNIDEQHSKVVGLLELNGAGDWSQLLPTGIDDGVGLLELHLEANRVDTAHSFRTSDAASLSVTRLVSFDLPLHANGFD